MVVHHLHTYISSNTPPLSPLYYLYALSKDLALHLVCDAQWTYNWTGVETWVMMIVGETSKQSSEIEARDSTKRISILTYSTCLRVEKRSFCDSSLDIQKTFSQTLKEEPQNVGLQARLTRRDWKFELVWMCLTTTWWSSTSMGRRINWAV